MTDIINQYTKYLCARGLSYQTVRVYKVDVNQFANFLKSELDMDILSTITHTSLRFFFGTLHELGLSKRTIARKITSLKEFFKFCIRNNIIDKDPTKKLIYPKFSTKLPQIFTVQQMLDLIDQPDDSTNLGKRDKAILEVMYSSAVRISELSKIKFHDISFDRSMIKVHGKGAKDRYVPFGSYALAALRDYLKIRKYVFPSTRKKNWQSNPYLFISKNGNRLSSANLRSIINGYISQITNRKGFSPHSIRHSCATHMLMNGANLRTIQKMLGHKSVTTTEIYTQLSLKYVKDSYHKFHPLNSADFHQNYLPYYFEESS